jgi:hypothetical protein
MLVKCKVAITVKDKFRAVVWKGTMKKRIVAGALTF